MPTISLIIPAKNEAETIGEVIQRAKVAFEEMGLDGEIIVVDSSTDNTSNIAASLGAKVVKPEKLGYGNAYLTGFKQSSGMYLVLMDADMTYDPFDMKKILWPLLNDHYDMVMGSRLKGEVLPGSMPPLHRYIGNPFLTWLLNKLFAAGISDAHCGFRAITRDGLQKLNLRTGGMEFASEMVIEAARKGLKITEVPITYHPRKGESKLSSFSDGWRHVRFMMLYRPVPFLLIPGLVALLIGLALTLSVQLQGWSRMHSMILGGLLLLIGYQLLLAGIYFGAFGEAYGISGNYGIAKKLMSYHSLEMELVIGIVFLALGVILGLKVLMEWRAVAFGSLEAIQTATMAMILSILGIQTIFSGMFISLLLLGSDEGN
ncbi:MAG: glycosyltransferase family 2 protein [Methanotrichaceae archaeon]|nr:glycosyltransferase family 2 protein [Methanotrichaceae archaeon]